VSLGAGTSSAGPGPGNGGGLSTVPVPQPTGRDIVNQAAAVWLGKALFWDEQVGGDGQIACATSHFHAGAHNRAVTPSSTGVVGSQGIAAATFVAIGHPADSCGPGPAPAP
jgi:cytochrome c peroxidase